MKTPSPPATAEPPVTILVVEPDELVREMVASGLKLWDRRYLAVSAPSGREALELLRELAVDVVVTEIDHESEAGTREYLARLRELAPGASVLVLTQAPETVFRLGAAYEALLPKPPEMDSLLARVDQLVARGRESLVRGIELSSFLQVLAADRKSGTLTVRSRGRSGGIGLSQGRVVHAECEGRAGREALFEMLSWTDPTLSLLAARGERRTIDDTLTALLLEYSVRADHAGRD